MLSPKSTMDGLQPVPAMVVYNGEEALRQAP
jgi:hypothetical protein